MTPKSRRRDGLRGVPCWESQHDMHIPFGTRRRMTAVNYVSALPSRWMVRLILSELRAIVRANCDRLRRQQPYPNSPLALLPRPTKSTVMRDAGLTFTVIPPPRIAICTIRVPAPQVEERSAGLLGPNWLLLKISVGLEGDNLTLRRILSRTDHSRITR